MKIAVVGTGLMGLSSALEVLKQGGHDLTVFSSPSCKPASRCAGGMLAPYSESDSMDLDLQALAVRYSMPFWKDRAKENGVYYADPGTLVVSHEADSGYMKRFETYLPQGTFEYLDKKEIADKEKALSRFHEGLWVYDEAHLNTAEILKTLKSDIQRRANFIEKDYIENMAVNFDMVIDARGAYADIEGVRKIKGERILLQCPDLKLSHCVRMMHPRYPLYIVPQGEDYYVVGATMIEDNHEEDFTVRAAMELLSAVTSLGGHVLESRIISMESGFRSAFRDHRPRLIQKDNIIYCNGLYRHGFLLAPVLAKAIFSDLKEFNCVKENDFETVH